MTKTIYKNSDFVDFCQREVTDYARQFRGVDMVVLSTPAGFEIASYANSGLYDRNKLAALSSSLFRVGDSVANSSRLKPCESVLVDTNNGKVFISCIPEANYPVILAIKVNSKATIGNMIHSAGKLNERLRAYLDKITSVA